MCEKKPGPRCSNDALKAVQTLSNKVKEQEELIQTKKSSYREPNYFADDYDEFEREEENRYIQDSVYGETRKLEDLKNQLRVANRNYDATPDGINSIKRLIAVSGNAYAKRPYTAYAPYIDDDENEGVKNVEIPISKHQKLSRKLKRAEDHREWQSKISKGLKTAETESPAKALFIAKELRSRLNKEEEALDLKRKATTDSIRENGFKLYLNDTPELKASLAKNFLDVENFSEQIEYGNIRAKDLDSYINEKEKDIISSVKKESNLLA